jgi:uncharacterized protein (TIGR02217 family)
MFKTTIIELLSGHEQRNIDWSRVRGEWDVAHGIKTQDELDELLAFFYARQGRAHGFRFKDWNDFRDRGQGLVLNDGGNDRLYKRYSSGGVNYDRMITKPVDGTIVLAGGGTVAPATGIVTGGTAGTAWTGEFDVPVRFDTDHMATRIEAFNVYTWGQVIIKEIRV